MTWIIVVCSVWVGWFLISLVFHFLERRLEREAQVLDAQIKLLEMPREEDER